MSPSPSLKLTKRQREILILSGQGLCAKGSARKMGCSFHTVKAHSLHARTKLEAKNLSHAIVTALQRGEISMEDFAHE
jgi:DNA-binding CsgD family transcriptional regulator